MKKKNFRNFFVQKTHFGKEKKRRRGKLSQKMLDAEIAQLQDGESCSWIDFTPAAVSVCILSAPCTSKKINFLGVGMETQPTHQTNVSHPEIQFNRCSRKRHSPLPCPCVYAIMIGEKETFDPNV